MTKNSQDSLRSKVIFAFFAFAVGMAVASLISHKSLTPVVKTHYLFEYKGKEVQLSDLAPEIAVPLYDELHRSYEAQMALLKSAALQLHVKRQAQANKVDEATMAQTLLSAEAATEEEVSNFWKANMSRIQRPFNEVEAEIKAFLLQQKINQRRDALLAQLQQSGDLAFALSLPDSPSISINTEGYPSKGSPTAKVHVIEFADYQCPHCKIANAVFKEVETEWGSKIKVTFMDFPVNRSGISRIIAEGAVCADEQGRFWDFHNLAFAEQDKLNADWPKQTAKTLTLNLDKFTSCLTAQATKDKVIKSEQAALAAGVRGTPSIFINGIKLSGHDLKVELNNAISSALKSHGG